MKYIIEHLEPALSDWCFIEYKHISEIVGKENLIFTNVKNDEEKLKLQEFGEVKEESVSEMKLTKACVLDPNVETMLQPSDSEVFEYVIFGGILGEDPPKARTEELITSKVDYETRNMGDKQMSTDTAVLVAHKILNGTAFEKIPFKDGVEIEVKNKEGIEHTIELPYRYVLENGKVEFAKGLVKYLEEKDEF
jgi:ribosome biogenesis SPOUT family RNA methylase Rps3